MVFIHYWLILQGTAGPSNYKGNRLRVFLAAITTAVETALQEAIGNPVLLPTIESISTATYEPEDARASHLLGLDRSPRFPCRA
jgi:hypothetical protein